MSLDTLRGSVRNPLRVKDLEEEVEDEDNLEAEATFKVEVTTAVDSVETGVVPGVVEVDLDEDEALIHLKHILVNQDTINHATQECSN